VISFSRFVETLHVLQGSVSDVHAGVLSGTVRDEYAGDSVVSKVPRARQTQNELSR